MIQKSEDWEVLNRCLLRLYGELDQEKHARLMLQVVTELVPAESAVLSIFTLPDKLTCISRPENLVTSAQAAAMVQLATQSPFPACFGAPRDTQWKMTTDFLPVEDFPATDSCRQVFARHGINQQITGVLAIVEDARHLLTLHRRSQAPFTERERDLLNTLQPHLAISHLNALTHSRARQAIGELKAAVETAPGAYGYFNGDGKLVWLQEKAAAWLYEFFHEEVQMIGKIPQSVIFLLQESLRGDRAPQQLSKTSDQEILNACLVGSAPGGWILRLERRPRTPPPHFRPLPQFSERKNDVLRWMVEGKRNAEIAAILYLSPRTVERHVTEILAGLNVENRATAIVRAMEYCAAASPGGKI